MKDYSDLLNETIFNGCFRNIDIECHNKFISNIQKIETIITNKTEIEQIPEKQMELLLKLLISERIDEFDMHHLKKLKL